MSRECLVSSNPVTRERAVLLTDPREHPESVLVTHLFVSPGGRVAAPHFHRTLTERFLVLEGQVGFMIDGEETILSAGGTATVPPNSVHDWWQVGETGAEALVEVDPGDRFLEMVSTIFGLARDGKVNDHGLPDPLQLAVIGREFDDVVTFTTPPPLVQKLTIPPLAALGRALGRRPTYPEYIDLEETEQADPRALEALTPEGRLRPDA
jgi:quercetin dioxygenase-like cupin family protein